MIIDFTAEELNVIKDYINTLVEHEDDPEYIEPAKSALNKITGFYINDILIVYDAIEKCMENEIDLSGCPQNIVEGMAKLHSDIKDFIKAVGRK